MSNLGPRELMLNQIELNAGKFNRLNHVNTNDRSHPFIEYRTQIKQNNRYILNKSIQCPPSQLRHVSDVCDRSAPVIDPKFQLRYHNRRALLDGVLSGAESFYHRLVNAGKFTLPISGFQASVHHVVQSGKEKSAHIIEAGKEALHHASSGHLGQAVSNIIGAVKSIASSSNVEVHNDEHHYSCAFLAEIADNRLKLHHGVQTKDRSRPFIPSAEALAEYNANRVQYKHLDRRAEVLRCIHGKAVLRTLNHVSIARDCSKPNYLPYHVNIHRNFKRDLVDALKELPEAAVLHHVDCAEIEDRSAPRVIGKVNIVGNKSRQSLLQEVKSVAGKPHVHEVQTVAGRPQM